MECGQRPEAVNPGGVPIPWEGEWVQRGSDEKEKSCTRNLQVQSGLPALKGGLGLDIQEKNMENPGFFPEKPAPGFQRCQQHCTFTWPSWKIQIGCVVFSRLRR